MLAALAADLILNWYFTVPIHHWTIAAPPDLIALVLFIASAVTVSSVVHSAARRAHLASERATEAAALLELARTVLGGDDTPDAVLAHLTTTLKVRAGLYERHGARWLRIAGSSGDQPRQVTAAGDEFWLVTYGTHRPTRRGSCPLTPPKPPRPANATDCGSKPAKPKCWPKATGCAPLCSPR